ncbi:MAG: glycosyltransferase [Terracidiphilus sp.]|jgi:glycosyltransferase involved in cell wall biosynthesis
MKHVAIVIPGIDRIGGAERQAMLLAEGLRDRDWRVSVVALSGTGGSAAAELQRSGVGFVSLEMRKGLADPRGWIRFHRWLKRERPDVVHAHLPHAAWMARWSRLAADVPVVVDTLHSSSIGGRGRRIGYMCSRRLTDHVTAVSHAAMASHLAAGMVREENLSVLANGIDVDAWEPDARTRAAVRRELGVTDDFLWIAVGRLEQVKDYPTLLRAFRWSRRKARLVILGAGPMKAELTRLAGELGLERRTRFLGFEPDVRRRMQAADGVVLASRHEGLPMVLLEAGACGLPSVATDVAGTQEVIVDGVNGWLARAGDVRSLAAAMERLMNAPFDKRREMSECAKKLVTRRFGMAMVLDRWEELYEELLCRESDAWRNRRKAEESLRDRDAA